MKSVFDDSLSQQGPFSDELLKRFDGGTSREFLELFCGARLGHGMSREVFVYRIDPKYVIKFELCEHTFQNIREAQAWETVQYTEQAKWFAPVKAISGCGRIMLQQRTEELASIALPAEMPAFFCDFKPSNYGRIGKQVVCHDYGTCLLMTTGITKRMKRADWS